MADNGDANTEYRSGGGVGESESSTAQRLQMRQIVSSLKASHGQPTRVAPALFKAHMAEIYRVFGASGSEARNSVENAMTYVAIVYGTGTNIATVDIDVSPPGCKTLRANIYVDDIIGRKFYRRFMAHFSDRAKLMHDSSTEIQDLLKRRAIRNGLPVTETEAVIDFLDSPSGMSTAALAFRERAKYSALQRANAQGETGMGRAASQAARAMHDYHDSDSVLDE